MSKDRAYKLTGLFFMALLLFNFPLLGLFGRGAAIGGIPLLYLYLFLVWGILIFLTMRIAGSTDNNKP